MAKSKGSTKESEVVADLDFQSAAQGVEASGKRGRPKTFTITSTAKSVIRNWLDSDAPILPFRAIDEQLGDEVFGELVDLHDKSVENVEKFHENMLAKARGEVLADEVDEVTKSQTKIAKALKEIVEGRAEVRALDYQGQPTFGLVRRSRTEG